mgnify:CR=1 FL=1
MQAVSSLDFDIDSQMSRLEVEWRQAFESSMLARADFESLSRSARHDVTRLRRAAQSMERAEARKAHVMRKIARLEQSLLES